MAKGTSCVAFVSRQDKTPTASSTIAGRHLRPSRFPRDRQDTVQAAEGKRLQSNRLYSPASIGDLVIVRWHRSGQPGHLL